MDTDDNKKLKIGFTHYEWGEDEHKCSSWAFNSGSGRIMYMGDGIKKLLEDEIIKQLNTEPVFTPTHKKIKKSQQGSKYHK